MKKNKQTRVKVLSILLAAAMLIAMIPSMAFAETTGLATDAEWYNFRNNQENNGVTDRATPMNSDTAALKWAQKYSTSFFAGVTPPVIVDGYLYMAVGNKVIKADKNTGEKVAESEQMAGSVGFAMKPITYADGKLFVQVSDGVIQAVDLATLKCVWSTEKISGQTISPISYAQIDGKGYIFTGTWNQPSNDGVFMCISTDDSNVDENKIKKTEWRFIPSGQTASLKNLIYQDTPVTYDEDIKAAFEEGDPLAKRGFYWAGAYACNKFVALGSDDGANDYGAPQESACFYTLNPLTGEIIDKIGGIKGDIRTTTVYDNGNLYFCTKGGTLYRVPVDANGKLGEAKCVELGGEITATPAVYNGRAYMGVRGQGGQFDPNGGHRFAVVDVNTMTELYGLPISGYPQEGALLSTAYENEDFNGDGVADGRVYLYFTYNSYPGGICYTYDAIKPEDANKIGENLFEPDAAMQNYCISPICADKDGTLYYKNDSGYLMAVQNSKAYITDIEADGAVWSKPFTPGTVSYEVKVPADRDSFKFKLTLPLGVTATVNGEKYDVKNGANAALDKDGKAEVTIVATAEGGSTTYNIAVSRISRDSSLKNLIVSNSNTYGEGAYKLTPNFSADKTDYTAYVGEFKESFYRIWPEAADDNATVSVTAVDNVEKIALSNNGMYYAVYQKDKTKAAKVKVEVTSENGEEVTAYTVTVDTVPAPPVSDKPEPPKTGDQNNMTLWIAVLAATICAGFATTKSKKQN